MHTQQLIYNQNHFDSIISISLKVDQNHQKLDDFYLSTQ